MVLMSYILALVCTFVIEKKNNYTPCENGIFFYVKKVRTSEIVP